MAIPYKPVVTQGSENPKCNQFSGALVASPSIPNAADVADQAMRKRAAERAAQEAYRRAKAAPKGKPEGAPKRWLSNEDIA